MSEEEHTVLMGPEAGEETPSVVPEPPAPEAPAFWAEPAQTPPVEAAAAWAEPTQTPPTDVAALDASPTAPEMPTLPPKVHRGNGWDITALLATATGVLAVLSCGTFGAMVYCLPLLPLILGIVSVVAARRAVEPRRSRVLGWIGVGSGALTTLVLVALVMVWIVAMLISFVLPFVVIALGAAGAAGGMPDWRNWSP